MDVLGNTIMIPETYERLHNSERGVSPVIGVILMVAITVILAAVIAAFVLGFGAGAEAAPQASISIDADADGNNVTIEHLSGDSIDYEELFLRGELDEYALTEDFEAGETLSSGDIITFEANEFAENDTINLVWDNGDDSAQLASTEA